MDSRKYLLMIKVIKRWLSLSVDMVDIGEGIDHKTSLERVSEIQLFKVKD